MSKLIDLTDKRVLISRTDSIGDVLLTLPICTWIKENFPSAQIIFLGKGYTLPIIDSFKSVDESVDWNEFKAVPLVDRIEKFRAIRADVIIHVFPHKEIASLAKKVKIPTRVGTSHRAYHLLTCNVRLNFTRKRSEFHEAQLNHELLRPFGLKELPSLVELEKSTREFQPKTVEIPSEIEHFIQKHPNFTVLHPKSQGSAVEWPIEKYVALAKKLANQNQAVIFTGTNPEGAQFRGHIPTHDLIIDTTGKLSLDQLIALISRSKHIVACSTGPLHIGGFVGTQAVGLYSPKRPIHPGRWQPIGQQTIALVNDEECEGCKANKACDCIAKIDVEKVLEAMHFQS